MQRNIARAGALAGGLTILTAAVPAAAQSPIATAIAAAATARPATPQALSLGGRKLEAKLGKSLIVKGHGPAGRTARLQLDSERGWQTIGTAKIHADGTFRVQAKPAAPTRAKTRVVAAGQKQMAGRAKVYRFAFVSWYGPGLYGGHL
ncbi:MAG: hypothetical protein QOF76_1519, partial [Solirubrobacteraceae bacterium]|nr:hypothetical protein [Solirubrobacteraceae bacterium]